MKTLHNEPLAPYTSLRVGGVAEKLVIVETRDEMVAALQASQQRPWLLGFGCNVLVSDKGLPGTTIMWHGGDVSVKGTMVIADAGVWWDDVVRAAIEHKLWGLELLSEIPSSTGGAVFGNIAAYGGQVSDTLAWVELYDMSTKQISRHIAADFQFSYRQSSLQQEPTLVILRAGFELNNTPVHELRYESALAIAREKQLDINTLEDRRAIIVETRRRAGSLYDPNDTAPERTAGSFFKNPIVSLKQAKDLARFDESGKTLERILEQSKIHGGSTHRASAAHVLLAAGFHRGQQWGSVMLHPSHVLKVTTLPGATAGDVYDVVRHIQSTVEESLGTVLEPEVRFLGDFS